MIVRLIESPMPVPCDFVHIDQLAFGDLAIRIRTIRHISVVECE